MRSFFYTVVAIVAISTAFAAPPVRVMKERGGLFGYETVTQINDASLITLLCQGRGFIRCKLFSGNIVVGDNDEIVLTDADVNKIERLIGDQTGSGNTSGVINYNEQVVVSFSYDKATDKLIYTLYSIPQAIHYSII